MSFTNYKTLSQVLQTFHLSYQEQNFIELKPFEISDYLRTELQFNRTDNDSDSFFIQNI
jgi:hypothetical protein